jgi:tRNA A37 threonylcarbamoyladenosine dehydratase/nitroreductase
VSRPDSSDELWAGLPQPDAGSWQPVLFDAQDPAARDRLMALSKAEPWLTCLDTLAAQLQDLARTSLKDKHASEASLRAKIDEILGGTPPGRFGTWVYFPWRRQLVHVLPKPLFRQLRLDRNLHKITRAEQHTLLGKSIACVGLSVGSAALTTLALEGIGGHYRIADFDALDLSNLNRLRSGVADLGTNKAVLAARAIFEIDPYLDVQLFPEGVRDQDLEQLFAPPLDLLIEECDDLPMKVRLRERARAGGIPVVMETTDRGMLDIERFDLEPSRPLFHGRVGNVDANSLRQAKSRDRVPFVLGIIDEARISTRMAASLVEMEKTVYTWPQLASAVALGGALIGHAARNLLLGTHTFSGRFYVDLDECISRERATPVGVAPEARIARATPAPAPVCPELPARVDGELSASLARFLVEHAVRAPSGGNSQPWVFRHARGALDCNIVPERANSFLDFGGQAAELALGAAVQNICIAASCLGYTARVARKARDADAFARLTFEHSQTSADSPLRHAIFERVTHRHQLPPEPMTVSQKHELSALAVRAGLGLRLLDTREERSELGAVLGAGDRLRFQIDSYHSELTRELRWTDAETERTRTGIDVATLESSPADLAGFKIVERKDVMRFIEREGLGQSLEDSARKACHACSAMGLLSLPDGVDAFESGRRLQQLWLQSTLLGIAWQPWAALLAMHARATAGTGLGKEHKAALLELGQRLYGLWELPPGHTPLFVFRALVRPPPPSARSLRLPVSAVSNLV